MADHLKRYRDYIADLKRGQSSGISGAFGRATDLLPPEVMAIKAPSLSTTDSRQRHGLGENVLAAEFDREYLRQAVETLVQEYADDLEDPVGKVVATASGQEEVLSVYVENGERMFMLSDLSVIDEESFRRGLVTAEIVEDEPEPGKVWQSGEMAENPADLMEESTNPPPPPPPPNPAQSNAPVAALPQSVTTAEGVLLWQVYYDTHGPELVSMADGGIIKRAQGRREYVFSNLSALDGDIKFFILSGFIVDPGTGNVYLEANEGAYTAAFLNNGWRIHQYREHNGEETYFVSEPMRPDRAPATIQVRSLSLDPVTGEVSYETMDSAASITLRSRQL